MSASKESSDRPCLVDRRARIDAWPEAAGVLAILLGFILLACVRYDWIRHEVWTQPELSWLSYLLPAAVLLLCIVMLRHSEFVDARARARIWLSAAAGSLTIVGLIYLVASPAASAWLLYGWIALLAWAMGCTRQSPLAMQPIAQPHLLLVFAVGGTALLLVWKQIVLWRNLSFGYHDIGLFARALHSATLGRGLFVDSLDRSILGEHAFFALWFLVPLCKAGIDPFKLLVVLSAASLAGTALVAAWYARRRLSSDSAALIAGLAWLLLPFHGCLVLAHGYGFHEVYLAVPFLFAGLAFGELGRPRAAAVIMLASLLIREDIALTVAAWGVYLVVCRKQRLVGALTVVISLAYLAAAVYLIVPHYRGEPYPHIGFHFANLAAMDARTLTTNASFLVTLLLPMAFLPLRSWRLALVAAPAVAETLLTTNPELHNIGFQYYVPAVPVLFVAAIESWRTIEATPLAVSGKHALPRAVGTIHSTAGNPGWALLVAAAASHVYLGVGPLSNNPMPITAHPTLQASFERIQEIRDRVPPSAGVTASYRIAAHFLDTDQLWTVANYQLGDFVIVHDADIIDEHLPRRTLVRALRTGAYQPIYADYHLVVLKLTSEPTALANELTAHAPPADLPPVSVDLGEGIELVGIKFQPTEKSRRYRLTLIWKGAADIDGDYRFGIVHGNSRWGPFYFARGAFPTAAWSPGRYYRDDLVIETDDGSPLSPDALKVVLLE